MNSSTKTSEKCDWLITINNPLAEGIVCKRFCGDTDNVKKCLISLIEEDKGINPSGFISATTLEEITTIGNEILAWATLEDYGIEYSVDYTAVSLNSIPEMSL